MEGKRVTTKFSMFVSMGGGVLERAARPDRMQDEEVCLVVEDYESDFETEDVE